MVHLDGGVADTRRFRFLARLCTTAWSRIRRYKDDGATLDDLRLAVTMLEETERTSRRVRGSAHPETNQTGLHLRDAQAALCARETPSPAESA